MILMLISCTSQYLLFKVIIYSKEESNSFTIKVPYLHKDIEKAHKIREPKYFLTSTGETYTIILLQAIIGKEPHTVENFNIHCLFWIKGG